jgi:hypothetical protein
MDMIWQDWFKRLPNATKQNEHRESVGHHHEWFDHTERLIQITLKCDSKDGPLLIL